MQGKKKQCMPQKILKKGRAEQEEDQFVAGGHLFEMRIEGSGAQCEAEQQLDEVCKLTSGFVQKAQMQSDLIDESMMRIGRLDNELERADTRLQGLHRNADRYCGVKKIDNVHYQNGRFLKH